MLLTDEVLYERGEGMVTPFDQEKVTNIAYDLSTELFCFDGKGATACDLAPGACVFVQAREALKLPNNMYAQLVLRNRRIRQGLQLTAPVYQPGHHTKIFFRLMNVSTGVLHLTTEDEFASLMLYELDGNVKKPYDGKFQSEFDFRDLGSYAPELAGEITELAHKVEDVRAIEKNIYGNVLAMMAVFVAVFSLINVNVSLVSKMVDMGTLLTLNLTTVGSIAALIGALRTCLPGKKQGSTVWIVCLVAYVLSVVVQFLPL